jgi:predicted nuclease of predicted toxin-antitoxin system
VLLGFPPKIIWIRRGNCSAKSVEVILSGHQQEIQALDDDPTNGVLTLF